MSSKVTPTSLMASAIAFVASACSCGASLFVSFTMEDLMERRECKGTTRAGDPCKGNPLKNSDYCLAHADEETRASVGFGGARAGAMGGRPRKPTPSEIQRQLMERYELAVQRPYWRTLGYDVKIGEDGDPELVELPEGGAKLFGESKDGFINVSSFDDLGAMIADAEKLQDRVYGRPRQRNEVTVVTRDAFADVIEKLEAEVAEREASADRDRSDPGGDRTLSGAAETQG